MRFRCQNVCYQPNELKTLDVSFGNIRFSSTAQLIMEEFALRNISITGLYDLKTLNMNYAAVQAYIRVNILEVSPIRGIMNLFLRATNVLLPNDLQLCSKMKNLTNIDLSQNNIEDLPQNVLRDCNELQLVNLSKNSIRSIPDEIHAWVEAHDVTIDLSGNPLACHCHDDVIKTITWLHKHKNKYKVRTK